MRTFDLTEAAAFLLISPGRLRAKAKAGAVPGLRWHDLRHAWASWLAQDGTPLLALQELGGWQSSAMVRRYAHFEAEHLRAYVERLADGEGTQNVPRAKLRVVK